MFSRFHPMIRNQQVGSSSLPTSSIPKALNFLVFSRGSGFFHALSPYVFICLK